MAKADKPKLPEPPRIFAGRRLLPLSVEEKGRLRVLLADPVMARALELAALAKPSAFGGRISPKSQRNAQDQQATAAARLSEIAGWELYEASLFMLIQDTPARHQAADHTFPEEGLPEFDPSQKQSEKK